MHRDDSRELRRVAETLFRALEDLGPAGSPDSLDLSACDALTSDVDGEHLMLQGKLCAQRLYTIGSRRTEHDQDDVVVLASTVDLVVRGVTRTQRADSDALRRLGEALLRLQGLVMRLDRLHAGGSE